MYFHDYDLIADRAKHAYARGTKLLADMQYRLAELAGTRRLDPEESMALQWSLVRIWEQLYSGTTYAARESVDYYDEFLAAGGDPADLDNHYSDGREVLTQVRIEPPHACPYGPMVGDGLEPGADASILPLSLSSRGRPGPALAARQLRRSPAGNHAADRAHGRHGGPIGRLADLLSD